MLVFFACDVKRREGRVWAVGEFHMSSTNWIEALPKHGMMNMTMGVSKNMGKKQIIHLLIGLSIIFTIHFNLGG